MMKLAGGGGIATSGLIEACSLSMHWTHFGTLHVSHHHCHQVSSVAQLFCTGHAARTVKAGFVCKAKVMKASLGSISG